MQKKKSLVSTLAARHRDLAIKMQYLEASIILHTALPALKKIDPTIRVLTVHDEIYLPIKFTSNAMKCLSHAFLQHAGNTPEVRISSHQPLG